MPICARTAGGAHATRALRSFQPSVADARVALRNPNGVEERFVHASRWYNHISALRVMGALK
jgi:hypothetical protein